MCQVPGSYNGKKTCLAHKLNHRFLRMHVFRFVACIILIAVLIIFSEQSAATRLEKLLSILDTDVLLRRGTPHCIRTRDNTKDLEIPPRLRCLWTANQSSPEALPHSRRFSAFGSGVVSSLDKGTRS
ncbi:uncharacterized protein LOC116654530 isoform X4 [Drosophila ananassae]|uniref:uncharacterized protein LOC116654530 isoform X4 n=1 Tax=Drosophila ananassae TaxID=7217 RepID=UPI001CFFF434|nr:uncharacterized protein LOC116654530 isoform X4 [Drosophila ananassae]